MKRKLPQNLMLKVTGQQKHFCSIDMKIIYA
jgi:hypothetical protein